MTQSFYYLRVIKNSYGVTSEMTGSVFLSKEATYITHLSSLFLTIGLSKFANTCGYHGMFILEAHIGVALLVPKLSDSAQR